MKLLALTIGVGAVAAQDSGCAEGMTANYYSTDACDGDAVTDYAGAAYGPTDVTVGCYNPLAALGDALADAVDVATEEAPAEEEAAAEDTDATRRLQDGEDVAAEVEGALEEAPAEEEAA